MLYICACVNILGAVGKTCCVVLYVISNFWAVSSVDSSCKTCDV